jgi:MOSC domain-containing protein YiiM
VLREIAQQQDAQFGVYAEVLVPGEARVGDPVKVL